MILTKQNQEAIHKIVNVLEKQGLSEAATETKLVEENQSSTSRKGKGPLLEANEDDLY
jgi:hypothetical protein